MEHITEVWTTCREVDPFWRSFSLLKLLHAFTERSPPRFLFLASHLPSRKRVVIKFINSSAESLPEVENVTSLRHPNIINFERVIRLQGWWILCMKYSEHGDGVQLMHRKGRLNERSARKVFVQLLRALQFLHSVGYAHRDVKLDNILLGDNDWLTLTDFEFSACVKTAPYFDRVGTFLYSAPEVRAGHENGFESDMWASGVTLFCLVFGKFPFSADCLEAREEALALVETSKDCSLSPACKDLICNLLRKNPRHRLTAAEALLHPWCTGENFERDHTLQRVSQFARGSAAANFVYQSLKTLQETSRESGKRTTQITAHQPW